MMVFKEFLVSLDNDARYAKEATEKETYLVIGIADNDRFYIVNDKSRIVPVATFNCTWRGYPEAPTKAAEVKKAEPIVATKAEPVQTTIEEKPKQKPKGKK